MYNRERVSILLQYTEIFLSKSSWLAPRLLDCQRHGSPFMMLCCIPSFLWSLERADLCASIRFLI